MAFTLSELRKLCVPAILAIVSVGTLGQEPSTPSMEETVAYINTKLAENPTPAYREDSCKTNPRYQVSVTKDMKSLFIAEYDRSCETTLYEIGISNLSKKGEFADCFGGNWPINHDSSSGALADYRDYTLLMVSCKTSECVKVSDTITGKVRHTCGVTVEFQSDKTTRDHLSKAFQHLIGLAQQGKSDPNDPFGK